MKILFFLSLLLSMGITASTQTLTQKIQKAFQQFESDTQLENAISSLHVVDAATGKVVFSKNSKIGLAPASTQKIITAATAYELLGKDYRFKTEVRRDPATNSIYITGYGDPSLGSFRFRGSGTVFFMEIDSAFDLRKNGVGEIIACDPYFEKLIPDGWIYQDLGNYYGAASYGLNWNENQVDVTFIPGKVGEPAVIDSTLTPMSFWSSVINDVKTGPAGSGDNSDIYLTGSGFKMRRLKGTIPAGVKRFTVSGSELMPICPMEKAFGDYYAKYALARTSNSTACIRMDDSLSAHFSLPAFTHYSETLDTLSYWFLQKSVNLYGEAFVKAFAFQKYHYGSTDEGVQIIKDFWKSKGINENEINMFDGSGLSPQNRTTTHAQVEVLKYARKQPWFAGYFKGFPNYNDMKMKSGTIRNVKGFAGYHKAKNGKEYIFSFLVNNYNGSTSSLVNKMYKVLDLLK